MKKESGEISKVLAKRSPADEQEILNWSERREALVVPRFEQHGKTARLAGDETLGAAKLAKTLATDDGMLASALITQVARATVGADVAEAANIGLAAINAVAPADGLEAMLATQMAACHDLTMKFMARVAHESDSRQLASFADMATKFSRTFVAQLEALARLRNRGQQRVVVEHQHVTVQAGGQAVVGGVQDLRKTESAG